ncbi:unnamed protein product [Chironomus riparius]|uniref:Serine protease HTRA2, mitochondrial n=1 Tax=Chironomus riparius TaxID=315576 RepID=A0A9N9WTX4_9DIPT|nr:unnamed protein product [Chironomus riparius]
MNNLTKFNRNIVNRMSLYRSIIITTSVVNRNKRFYGSYFSAKNVKSGFLLSCGLCCGLIGYNSFKDYFNRFLPSPPTVSASTKTSPRHQFNFIADVVESTSKSLVYIEIQDTRRMDYMTGKPATVSNGSGFIVSSDGLILTNAHVVINKPRSIVSVKLHDGRTFQGFVEAVDPISDLATVRINCKNLNAMKLGKSSDLRAGEWVVALGSPLSLSNTVTAGVVSCTQRPSQELGLRGRDINYIQTDAAITFGNSGGPLLNLDSEVIGINSMKVTANISFAIPIDYAKNFLKQAEERLKTGKTTPESVSGKRYMGITMLSLTPDIIYELKQRGSSIPDKIQHGILVWKVISGSPAAVGGLMAGDIILSINGQEVTKSSDVYDILAESTGSKDILMMHVWRGKLIKIAVTPEIVE